MSESTGVIHGRFQVLHNDHLKYLMAGRMRCDHLVVAITNPDPMVSKEDSADPHRSLAINNPLSYFERYTMVKMVLMEAGLRAEDFSVVPFPINVPELYTHYIPLDGTFFLTIYDEWGKRKLEQFRNLGLKTEVLWTRSPAEKGLRGSDIRKKMSLGEPWEHLVPEATQHLMKKWFIPERLRRGYQAQEKDEERGKEALPLF